MAALHFGVALRLTPASASAVLEAIGERRGLPLDLVRGDALRLLGNQTAAAEAYQSVATELRAPAPAGEGPLADPRAEPPDVGEEPIEAADEPEEPAVEEVESIASTEPPPVEPELETELMPQTEPVPEPSAEPVATEPAPDATSQTEPAPEAASEPPPLRWDMPDDL
jgi:hypothetical protein